MRKTLIPLILGLGLLITACYLDNPTQTDFPSWAVQFDLPLMQESLAFSDLVSDSLFTTQPGANGDSIYAVNQTINIDTTRVGNQLQIGDIKQSFGQAVDAVSIQTTPKTAHAEIGPISLPDIGPLQTDEFSFSAIMPPSIVGPIESALNTFGSITVDSIPGTSLQPVTKSFSFGDFKSATFQSGTIDVTIHNNMLFDFGKPFTISLVDTLTGTAKDSVVFNSYIPQGSSDTQVIDLAGKTLADVNGIRVRGHSDGSQGSPVTFNSAADLDKGFYVEVNVQNMVITSADAKIPAQVIAANDTVTFQQSSTKIEQADIATGSLDLSIDNSLPLSGTINLTISSLVDGSNNPFQTSIPISPSSSVQDPNDLSAYTLVMDTSAQQLEYSYTIQTTATDPGYATVSQNDSVNVGIDLSNLSFSSVTGYFSSQALAVSDSLNLQTDHQIQQAVLDSGRLVITITNNMGLQADVDLGVSELHTPSNGSFSGVIPLPAPGGTDSVVYDLHDYSIQLTGSDQILHYSSDISLDPTQLMTLNFNDSLDINIRLADVSFSSITGVLSPVTIDIGPMNEEISALPDVLDGIDLSSVDLTLDFVSNIDIPVYLDLSIYAYNDAGEVDSLVVNNWNITDTPDTTFDGMENLINLHPNRFVASGSATIGDGVTSATISKNEFAAGSLQISAPLSFQISGDVSQEVGPESVNAGLQDNADNIERLTLYADLENQFLFGASVEVLAAKDTLSFEPGAAVKPDTLAILDVNPGTPDGATARLDSVILDSSQFKLFRDSLYIKADVHLLGQPDGTTDIRTTDSLFISLYGSVKYLNDLNEQINSENQ